MGGPLSEFMVGEDFDGRTYNREFDLERLNAQMKRVYHCMVDGNWRTLEEISVVTGDREASISARLRDLRKDKFGGFLVERRSRGDRSKGLFEYRLEV